jgi:acetyl esterase/lipase
MPKVPFITEKRRIPVGSHSIRLLILRPRLQSAENVPGVLWIHGGGYQSLSAKTVFLSRALSLTAKYGAVLVAPDYRLSKKHPYPAALHDCYTALRYLKEHAEELGVRSDQIMVGGESAGGGMTAALCMLAHDRGEVKISYQFPLYPMIDCFDTDSSRDNHSMFWNTKRNHEGWSRYLGPLWGSADVPAYASPSRREDHSGLPPCYTFVGDGEPFYCETVKYVEDLRAAGVPAEVDVYHVDVHAFDALFPMTKAAKDARASFLRHFAAAVGADTEQSL